MNNATPIHNITEARTQFERRYRFLKQQIIKDMRERQGSYNIDYALASDIACDLAMHLPENIQLFTEGAPVDMGPDEPGWVTPMVIIAFLFALIGISYVLTTQL